MFFRWAIWYANKLNCFDILLSIERIFRFFDFFFFIFVFNLKNRIINNQRKLLPHSINCHCQKDHKTLISDTPKKCSVYFISFSPSLFCYWWCWCFYFVLGVSTFSSRVHRTQKPKIEDERTKKKKNTITKVSTALLIYQFFPDNCSTWFITAHFKNVDQLIAKMFFFLLSFV